MASGLAEGGSVSWMVGGVAGAGRDRKSKNELMKVVEAWIFLSVCASVCFTSRTFPNITIVPLQFVVFVDEAPGLIVSIRVPTQRF